MTVWRRARNTLLTCGLVIGGLYAQSSEPYDLGSVPFSYSWPTEPAVSRTINVPADMSLAEAAAVPGAHIIVAAGSYSGFTINRADQWFDLDDNAIINGTLTITRSGGQARTKFTGGQVVGSRISAGDALDFLFGGVMFTMSDGIYMSLSWQSTGSQRIAMINSTTNTTAYSWFMAPQVVDTNIILANNDFAGGQPSGEEATLRIMSATRLIVVDNRITNGGKHCFRNHGTGGYTYFARNQIEVYGSATQADPTAGGQYDGPLQDIYFVDNSYYLMDLGQDFLMEVQYGGVDNFTVSGNTSYKGDGSGGFNIGNTGSTGPGTGLNFTNNSSLPYQAPPAFTGGASASVIPTTMDRSPVGKGIARRAIYALNGKLVVASSSNSSWNGEAGKAGIGSGIYCVVRSDESVRVQSAAAVLQTR